MNLQRHRLGFFEAHPRPSAQELKRYYEDAYFRRNAARNQAPYAYTDEEIAHREITVDETQHACGMRAGRMLEIGVGEGFFLESFHRRGWEVRGLDFSADELKLRFPQLASLVQVGDVFELIASNAAFAAGQFDLVACNNVLDHVLDPLALAGQLRRLLAPGGVCRIAVPNDGSWLQREVVRRGLADDAFWVAYPDHLNYFDEASLRALLGEAGWQVDSVYGEFPIELFLLNPESNYARDKARGRNCHHARVAFEVALFNHAPARMFEFRRACAAAGMGRTLAAYLRLPGGAAAQGPR